MRRDEQFGPVIAFGLGGIFTEAIADVAFALAPLDRTDCRSARGRAPRAAAARPCTRACPRVDMDQLERIIRAIAQMAADHPEIAEIDVNPLLVSGTHLVAADALVVLSAPGELPSAARRPASPTAMSERLRLDAVFAPRSVAVVGASEDATKWGGSVMRNLLDGGFDGALYPINPRGGTIFGVPAYAGPADLPETPDLVIVALGGAHAAAIIAECGRSRRARGDRHRRGLRRGRGGGIGATAGACPGRRRERSHARRPQLHGRALHQLSSERRRLRDAAAGARADQRRLAVGQHRHAAADDRRATRRRRGEVREQRQPGEHRRQRPARVPGRRPADRRRGHVPRRDGATGDASTSWRARRRRASRSS